MLPSSDYLQVRLLRYTVDIFTLQTHAAFKQVIGPKNWQKVQPFLNELGHIKSSAEQYSNGYRNL